MISVDQNIKIIKQNMTNLIRQKKQIQNEIIKLQGSLKVFIDLKKLGVEEIPVNNNEVIDHQDISA